jgi:hypothetical protein
LASLHQFLYEAGARKIVVSNMPYLGCTPYLRYFRIRTRGQCSTKANKLASDFNGPFKDMLDTLNRELPEATIVQADAYGMMLKISNNYRDYGKKHRRSSMRSRPFFSVLLFSKRNILPLVIKTRSSKAKQSCTRCVRAIMQTNVFTPRFGGAS